LQRKLLTELRKARETQETATEIDMMKYAPPSIRQAYVYVRANQLLCKANADDEKRAEAELELIQVTAELAKAKMAMMTDAS